MRTLIAVLAIVLLAFPAAATSPLFTSSTGNVGISTTAPDQALTVAGAVHSTTTGFELPTGAFLSAVSGNTATAATTTGTFTNGDVAVWSSGNVADGGGAPGKVLLATVIADSASSVTFGSSYITGTYDKYTVEFDNMTPESDNVSMGIQVSSNNGSTWITSGYSWSAEFNSPLAGTPTISADGSTSASVIQFGGSSTGAAAANQSLGNGSNNVDQGRITFSDPNDSTDHLVFTYDGTYWGNTTNNYVVTTHGGGSLGGTNATMNAIKIFPSSGMITGNFFLYGED